MKRRIEIVIVTVAALLLAGCGEKQKRPWDTLTECEQENTELSMQLEELQNQNTQLAEQIATLSKLGQKDRLPAISTLEKIRIGKLSGFYDKDNDGSKETLVVYLEPIDTAQDTIKAVGEVVVELWDLNALEDNAKLHAWTVEPNKLPTAWGGNIFDSYYRLECPLENTLTEGKEYTVKATFTDYLSGKVLTDQRVIVP